MPNMDGLEFIKQVRANGNSVPIVMITTEGGEESSRKHFQRRKRQYQKAFTPDQLNEKLGGLL